MTGTAWTSVVSYMEAHHAMATRRTIVELGLPARTLRRRISQGLLVPVNSRVLALPGLSLDLKALTRGAVLARPSVIPTGPAAAAFLGSGPWDRCDLGQEPWLVLPDGRSRLGRQVTHPGIRVVRAGGLRVSHPADAVLDLIRFWPQTDALAVAQRSMILGTLTLDDLVRAQSRLARLAGAAQLRAVIHELREGTLSEGERRLVALLRDAGITGWIANHDASVGRRRYVIDVAFPRASVAIEVDGHAFHSDVRTFQNDRTRQNDLVRAGWTVLRFTWADITQRPEHVLAVIASTLASQRPA